jgi:imidazolonepropionase-like amidohydrolase
MDDRHSEPPTMRQGSLTLAGGAAWNARTGSLARADVVIRDGRVVAVGGPAAADHARVPAVDVSGCVLMPGLIDAHVHLTMDAEALNKTGAGESDVFAALRAAHAAEATLRAGFTTVRDMGGRNHVEMELRAAVENGLARGPRMLCAGRIVSMSCLAAEQYAGMYAEADGVDAVVGAVRDQIRRGADVVALIATGTAFEPGADPHQVRHSPHELSAAVQAAHAAGRRAAVHAEGIEGLWNGLRAGADTIELGTFLCEDESAARWMADHDVTLVPTMTVFDSFLHAPDDVDLGVTREQVAQLRDANRRSVQLAAQSGVAIACGGNTGMALQMHGSNARELQLLGDAGLSAEQVLAAATTVGAAALGADASLGRIEPNHAGDVIAVEAGALSEAISTVDTERLQLVVQAGVPVSGPRAVGVTADHRPLSGVVTQRPHGRRSG